MQACIITLTDTETQYLILCSFLCFWPSCSSLLLLYCGITDKCTSCHLPLVCLLSTFLFWLLLSFAWCNKKLLSKCVLNIRRCELNVWVLCTDYKTTSYKVYQIDFILWKNIKGSRFLMRMFLTTCFCHFAWTLLAASNFCKHPKVSLKCIVIFVCCRCCITGTGLCMYWRLSLSVCVSVCMCFRHCNTGAGRCVCLFLAQCELVDGCRCVAKDSSEISTDPGQSLCVSISLSLSHYSVVLYSSALLTCCTWSLCWDVEAITTSKVYLPKITPFK